MPSNALTKFENVMLKDVKRIIQTHESIQAGAPGNHGLGHLTRAGVLLLCAAWELYVEEILLEGVQASIDRADAPTKLPQSVQKTLADHVRGSKHQLKPLAMAGDGWKAVYLEAATEWVLGLNTPKKGNIDEGFRSLLGIADLSSCWSHGEACVNDFVTVRGKVAHRGSDAGSIGVNVLKNTYKPQISKCAIEIDNSVSTFIRDSYVPKAFPWNRRTI